MRLMSWCPRPKILARCLTAGLTAFTLLWVFAGPAAAHGVGGRLDLPVPLWQLAWAASFAVAASFVALGMFWNTPKFRALAAGRTLPQPLQTVSRLLSRLTAAFGLFALGLLLYAGLVGNTNPSVNITPVAIYIIFWVGLQAVSALVGNVWSPMNPFTTISDSAAGLWVRLRNRRLGDSERGAGNQWWAVAAIFAFVWLELAYHDSANIRVLGWSLAGYTAIMLAGAAIFGRGWLRDAEGFGVLFTKLAAMAPLHRHEGALRLRTPLAGLSMLPQKPGSAAFILVVLGSTTFDGFSRTTLMHDAISNRIGWERTAFNTVGLVFVILAVFVLYRAAIAGMAIITGDTEKELSEAFAPSLIPITAAYTIAHYFSYLLLEGQLIITHLSDPFGRGWDLFGTATYRVDYTAISTNTIAWTQTAAIAVGHVLAVALAHDRALERWPGKLAMRSQYPMLAAMIAYTIVGLLLLLGT